MRSFASKVLPLPSVDELGPHVSDDLPDTPLSTRPPPHRASRNGTGSMLERRKHSELHGSSASHADVLERVRSVSQMRMGKSSVVLMGGQHNSPELGSKNGSLASYFYAPHPQPGRGVCFSPKGDLLLRYGFGPEFKLMKSINGSLANTLKGSAGNVRFASFSPDGLTIMAASDDMHIFLFSVDSALAGVSSLLADIDVGKEPVAYCLMSPDGSVILSCDDDGQLETWSVKTQKQLKRYETGHSSVLASFSRDGKSIISCADFECGLVLLDARTAEIIATETFDQLQEGRNKAGYCISLDGRRVAVYVRDQTWTDNLAIYDVDSQTYTVTLVCSGTLLDVQFSSDGEEFIASGRDNLIHVFDAETMDPISILDGHLCDVMFCRVSGDRQYAISGDSDGLVFVWDIVNSRPILRLQAHNAPVVSCDISLDGTRAYTLDSEGHAHLWYLEMQGLLDVLQQSSDQLTCSQITADGRRMAVGYADGTVRLWTLGLNVSQAWQHNAHTCPVECLAVNPNTGTAATGGRDGTICLTSLAGGQVQAMLKGHGDVVTSLSYCFDGSRLLSSGRDGLMCLWDPTSVASGGATLRTLQLEPAAVSSTRPSPAVGNRKPTRLEGAAELTPIRVFHEEGGGVDGIVCCALNPRGTVAVGAASSGHVSLWDVVTGTLHHRVAVSDLSITSLRFRDDGRHVITGSYDGSVSVIEAEGGRVLSTLQGNASAIKDAYFERGGGFSGKDLTDVNVVSVCSRQAVTWEMNGNTVSAMADFIADESGDFFRNKTMQDRVFVAHSGLCIYDPLIKAAMYDMRKYDQHPGNSSLFRDGTAVLEGGVHHEKLILYTPPDKSIMMLVNETGGVKCLDFSPNGKLLVSGNLRGELMVWDVVHRQLISTWMAHKRSAINCIKFSHDSKQVYSCGEDAKVVLWSWRTCSQAVTLSGHQAPVVSVDMSLNGLYMVSGDKNGWVIIWDALKQDAKLVLNLHDGPVLCVSIAPDGARIISSGRDEHVCVIDCETGDEVFNLDDALDGRGLTVKFSFDGSRVQLGSEKGAILIWSVDKDCLLYDIQAHQGNVYDCSWSGDSRRLLSVGTDGKARLWDAAAGSELCQANFEHGFGVVDSGGFVKCDLSADGTLMAGCTAKGHLILWDIGQELRKAPNGQMLYQWLASMPVFSAKRMYTQLLDSFPLLYNSQDSRGWTVLMHAAANCSPEIVKVIVGTIAPNQGRLGLMASPLKRQPDFEDGRSLSRFITGAGGSAGKGSSGANSNLSAQHLIEPNAIRIAIDASSGDCVHHLLNAVLDEKVTSGSYHCVTKALSDVAEQYPELCEAFLTGLSLRSLGEIEIPSHIAAQGMIVKAATSYTSYKELWEHTLRLDQAEKGPMVVMEAVMVRLPFPAAIGNDSLLHTLGESRVPVRTFGSETVNAIITYKWRKFAQRQIYTKTIIYLVYLLLYTVYAVLLSDDPGPLQFVAVPVDNSTSIDTLGATNGTLDGQWRGTDFNGLAGYQQGRAVIALSFIVFFFGSYFLSLEGLQLVKLGAADYFSSFWNFMDLFSYAASMVIPPCVLLRFQMSDQGFVYALVAVEAILLWAKSLFYGLAVDGLGTFIYMIIQIIKGLKYFYVLLFVLYVSFGIALLNLFREPPSGSSQFDVFPYYDNIGNSLLSLFISQLQNQDTREALGTMYSQIAIIICCLYAFLANIIMINLIITLMSDLFTSIKQEQDLVFLRNRADLILEVESTMSQSDVARFQNIPPYLHLLKPINLEGKREEAKKEDVSVEQRPSPPRLEEQPSSRQKGGLATGRAHDGDGGGGGAGLLTVGMSRSASGNAGAWNLQHSTSVRSSRNGYGPVPRLSMKGGGGLGEPGDKGGFAGSRAMRTMARSRGNDRSLMTLESIRGDRLGGGAGGGGVGGGDVQSVLERQGRELAYVRRALELLLKHQLPGVRLGEDMLHDGGAMSLSVHASPAMRRMASVRHGRGVKPAVGGRDAAALPTSPTGGQRHTNTTFSPQGSEWDIDHAMSLLAAGGSRPMRHSASGALREFSRSESGAGGRMDADMGGLTSYGSGAGGGMGGAGGAGASRPTPVFGTSRVSSFKTQLLPVPEVRSADVSFNNRSDRASPSSISPTKPSPPASATSAVAASTTTPFQQSRGSGDGAAAVVIGATAGAAGVAEQTLIQQVSASRGLTEALNAAAAAHGGGASGGSASGQALHGTESGRSTASGTAASPAKAPAMQLPGQASGPSGVSTGEGAEGSHVIWAGGAT